MHLIQTILLIPLILANVGISTTNWWNSSASYLHARRPVITVNNNDFRMTEGGNLDPWLLRIMYENAFICGASYYSEHFALTSANCMHAHRSLLKSLRVEFLTPDIQQDNQEDLNNPTIALISAIIVSRDWHWPDTFMDVAVIKLSNRLRGNMNNFVKLCSNPLSSNDRLNVVSCGAQLTENVRTEEVTVVDRMECESNFSSSILGETVACAKEFKTTPGCMFSPGCPLTSGDKLCGIVAWGPACEWPGMPGIFTDIHKVRSFIQKAISGKGITNKKKYKQESDNVPEWHSAVWMTR
ncbi:seminase [Drosophila eugracilis]|uniref:seminase n=1 Tax=Drosophila eugracilis TaxID=29029 RepID=UPI001BD9AEBE|nr:seminase [Drosophila eugracilis]